MTTGQKPGVQARPTRTPRSHSVRTDKSTARRSAILRAALDAFCENGFAATRVEDVAARAGVAKGTIYLNFKDKQALFEELIRSTLGTHIARLEAVHLENGQRMRDTVEAIFLPMTEAARTGRLGDLMRLMIAESGRFPDLAELMLLWTTPLDKFAPLDTLGMLRAYLDLVFGPPPAKDKRPKRTLRPSSRGV